MNMILIMIMIINLMAFPSFYGNDLVNGEAEPHLKYNIDF